MRGTCLVGSIRHPFSAKQTVPTLLHLAKKSKFEAMISLLEGENHQFYLDECADSANHHGTLNMFMGKSTLQLMMTYRPPVVLVDLLIRRCREHNPNHSPEESVDMQGRTPLHAAVEHGCSFETCKLLMGDNLPVIMKDQMDRTPLHYACISTRQDTTTKRSNRYQPSLMLCQSQSEDAADADNSYKIARALVSAYPEATMIADIDGKTPIMLATESQADDRIVAFLASCQRRMERPTYCDGGAIEQLLESSMLTIMSSCASDTDFSSIGSRGVSAMGF